MRIIVCADDPLARAGLAAMLGSLPEILVVAEEAVALLTGDDPWPLDEQAEVVVWDVGWGGVADGGEDETVEERANRYRAEIAPAGCKPIERRAERDRIDRRQAQWR